MKGTEMTSSCKIGQDLLVKILSTLPPKTLMRFKCLAKWWYALINDPRFVDKHLSNSNSMNTNIHQPTFVFMYRLLTDDPPKPNEYESVFASNPKTDETESVFSMLTFCNVVDKDDDGVVNSLLSGVEDINIPLSMRLEIGDGESRSLSILGHCNGIICLSLKTTLDGPSKVFLWNPAIQESILLPPEKYLPDWLFLRSQDVSPYFPQTMRLDCAMGFGYDPISKGYKVVNIRFFGSKMYGDRKYVVVYPLKVEVYTLGTDSWREIKTYALETETTYLWPERFQMYFKGLCYWSGSEQHKEFIDLYDIIHSRSELEKIRRVIISFDMRDEVFHDVHLPDEVLLESNNSENYLEMHLVVWNGSIALFEKSTRGPSGYFGMWLMDDYGSTSKSRSVWTKHLGFDLESYRLYNSLALWKSDEVLLVSKNGWTICYNLRTKNLKYLPVQSAYRWVPLFAPSFYKANPCPPGLEHGFATPGLKDGYIKVNHELVVYVNSIVSVLGANKLES